MKHAQNVRAASGEILASIKREYGELLRSPSFSLETLFSPENFHFDDFCTTFSPHPQSEELKEIIRAFGEAHDIWMANAKHHITCALFLYPTADFERMHTMMKNLLLGFYLNDTMGRDIFKSLSAEQQEASRKMIRNMAALDETLGLSKDAHPLERINADILREFRDHSPKKWFREFLRDYCHHLDVTHRDGNADTLGFIPALDEYITLRCHYAGVHHIVRWIEYSDAQFLDWPLLRSAGIAQKLKRLHWVTAAFEALSNDLFSFEKEVIDCDADSNLVMVLALNEPGLSLPDALFRSCDIVRNLLAETIGLMEDIRKEMGTAMPLLDAHLDGVARCVKAGWMWHCHSKRYKRPVSIWKETTLVSSLLSYSGI